MSSQTKFLTRLQAFSGSTMSKRRSLFCPFFLLSALVMPIYCFLTNCILSLTPIRVPFSSKEAGNTKKKKINYFFILSFKLVGMSNSKQTLISLQNNKTDKHKTTTKRKVARVWYFIAMNSTHFQQIFGIQLFRLASRTIFSIKSSFHKSGRISSSLIPSIHSQQPSS